MLSSCPFCHIILPSSQLEWHANTHFARDELERDMELAMQISLLPQSLEAMDNPTDCLKPVGHLGRYPCNSDFNNDELNSKDGLEQEISLSVSLQSKSTLYNVEGDLMSLLKKCLESENGNSVSIISGYIDHYQTIESEDIGWGCGWRNIQMLSSHLLAERSDARDVMFGHSGFVPDIPSLQRWLEIAWKRGFDFYGSNFFNQKIYGSRKWIGATECATILRSFGLKARIVDFDGVNSRKQQNTGNSKCKMDVNQVYGPMDKFLKGPKHEAGPSSSSKYSEPKIHGPEVLLVWVWKYFNCEFGSRLGSSNSVLVSKKTPLYFQHDGHSRTIVGIQMQKAKSSSARSYSLLILDPAHRTAALKGSLNSNNGWQRMIKRGAHTLKKSQYQLCYVDPGIAAVGEEMEQLKYIDSILVEL
ncbi:zinc finger-containing ubiquitin peptidase 1-like [Zingiber officinale]|uniref:zinc finger-containing ubiquitin peptidase 1-like n=1 Tax=Zingiber officinale TaxID=94328 RepID=UPI001C4C5537|nr:zinc finger-containing ubiquitin peptidase 1-like [Zingiber officinale]XP_042447283.1 zinc finger-containing ubiquitin peptidase 1-like [Zingiber officinale]